MKLISPTIGSFINKGNLPFNLFLITFLLLLSSFSFSAEREDYDLDDDGLIEINDLADLDEIRNNLDGSGFYGSTAGCPVEGCTGFELTGNLNFDTNADGSMDVSDTYWNESNGWLPIGSEAAPFSAEFNGNDHTISNLYISRYGNNDIGLFSVLENSHIHNIKIEGSLTYVYGSDYVGIISGRIKQSKVTYSAVNGSVIATNNAGGIVGAAFEKSLIEFSHSKGSVRATSLSGGLVGYLGGSIEYYNTVRSSYSSANVYANKTAGGLVGELYGWGSVISSFSTGNISGNDSIGGLVGKSYGIGRIDPKVYFSSIEACFFTGRVTGGDNVGGLVGHLTGETNLGYSFNTGHITGNDSLITGPIVGFSDGTSREASRVYWATDTSNQENSEAPQLSGVGQPIKTLKCAIEQSVTVDNSIGCLPALNEEGGKNTFVLFNNWELFKYRSEEGDYRPYWVFGTDQQLPGLDINGVIYRDSDGDGALDRVDGFPLLAAAKVDNDGDGYPNFWDVECDLPCQAESGLILDQFPDSPAAWLDEDFDGKPDAWADSCDIDCQNIAIANGLELDLYLNDFDNDGLNDAIDPDDNADGIIDRDSDNDGLIEIHTLVEFDAIRNNLTGTGFTQELNGVIDSSGCPRKFINGQNIQECFGYELMEDLDFDTNLDDRLSSVDDFYNSGDGWVPIGAINKKFTAVFDGNNHSIVNLHINRKEENYVGLFSAINTSEIRNLNIVSYQKLRGGSAIGTLTGYAENSRFENIATNSEIESSSTSSGGLIGSADENNIITNCRTEGEIAASGNYSGGLVGYMDSNNIVSHSSSSVTFTSWNSYSGGLIGYIKSNNVINANYATGNLKGYTSIGGLIGVVASSNSISNNYATGGVSGNSNSGGLLGSIGRGNTIFNNFATGATTVASSNGGLIGGNSGANSISNSYWATDSTTHLTSSDNSDAANYIGLTLSSLQCATSGSESSALNGCVIDNANPDLNLPLDTVLYKEWELAGENNDAGEFESYWDFGTNQQLPVLIKDGVVLRDTDADGIFDQYDVYINIPLGDRDDMDKDGAPDFCSTSCLEAGMVDDIDVDGDGVPNDVDAYPEISSSNYLDTDLDGIPDECDLTCEELGLSTDNDDDNDLIPDLVDAFPLTFEIAVDADRDGLADAWTDACNIECRNASDIVLDLYLNDFDNDGLEDGEGEGFDTDLTADNGLPELLTIPAEANTRVDNDEGTVTTFNFYAQLIDTLTATDVVDDALIYEARFAEHTVLIDPTENEVKQLALPSGRQVITWTAIDDAGNRSNSLQQVINVYPRVRFATTYSQVEENTQADIKIELTAASPFYPVDFEVQVDLENSSVNNNDFVSSAQIDITLPFTVRMLAGDDEDLNTQVSLSLPIAQDNIDEVIERISLELIGASDDINASNYFTNIKSALVHTLDIREESFDDDGDGILDVDDAFSLNAAASVDTDNDGQPDSWNANCDFECYSNSNLTLDLDDDNDGTPDTQDLYPLNAAVAIDNDNDGLPDQWAPGCDIACQNNSGFTLDQYLNDSDNDGLINALDSQHGVDSGKPILTSVPGEMSSAVNTADSLHAKITIDINRLQEFSATDAVDTSVYFRPLWNGSDLAYENGNFELPIGRQVIQWVAIDDAGNRSDPMEQVINVYPEIQFNTLTSVTGEGSTAQIQYELTGPSPVYPVKVGLKLSFEDTSAMGADIQVPANDSRFISKTHYFDIDAGQGNTPNTQGVFEIPIASDGIDEDDEFVFINILSIENVQVANNYFAIVDDRFQHKLTITDENLAPEVSLEILQRGISVDEIDVDHGEVVIRAVVNDPNGDDRHTYEWDLAEFGLNMEIANTIRMDPKEWVAGEYEFSIEVSDTGNPVMSVELNTVLKVVKTEDQQPEGNGEEDPAAEEENPGEQAGESPANEEGGEASSDSSSGSGALGYGLFLLLLLSLYHRQRITYKY